MFIHAALSLLMTVVACLSSDGGISVYALLVDCCLSTDKRGGSVDGVEMLAREFRLSVSSSVACDSAVMLGFLEDG